MIIKKMKIVFALFLICVESLVFAQEKPELVLPLGHSDDVNSIAISLDGKYVVSGSDDYTIKIWDVSTGREIRTIVTKHKITSVAFSPDGQFVISGSYDQTLKLWNTTTGKLLKTFEAHLDVVNAIVFLPNGKFVLSGSSDKALILWDVQKAQPIRKFIGHSKTITSVAVTFDGKYSLSGSRDNTAVIWDIHSGKKIREFVHSDAVLAVAFSPDGKLAVTACKDGTLKIWDIDSGTLLRTFTNGYSVDRCIAVSPDGKYILSGREDHSLILWDAIVGQVHHTWTEHTGNVNAVAFSPDGKLAFSASHDKTIRSWNIGTNKSQKIFTGHFHSITDVKFSPNIDYILTGDKNGQLTLWDLVNGQKRHALRGHKGIITKVGFSPDGNYALSASGDQTVKIWEMNTGKELLTFRGHRGPVTEAVFLPDGKHILSGGGYKDNSIKLWNYKSGIEILTMISQDVVEGLAVSPDGRYAVSSSYYDSMSLWDLSSGSLLRSWKADNDGVSDVVFSPDGNLILASGGMSTIKLWDVQTSKEVRAISPASFLTTTVSFSPDGKYILSATNDNTLRLWETSSGKIVLTTLSGHNDHVSSSSFSSDGRMIVSGSDDATVRLWNCAKGDEIMRFVAFDDAVNWFTSTPDGFYYGSKGSFDKIHFVKGLKVFSFDQFDLQYNRPDIILERLGKAPKELIFAYRKAWEKRLHKMGFNPNNFEKERSFNVPQIILAANTETFVETSTSTHTISFTANDNLYKLDRLFIQVNGVPLFGLKGKSLSKQASRSLKFTETIPLSSGKNIIKISVLNEKGVESLAEQIEIIYTPQTVMKPTWHIIAIGVSKFVQSNYNLTYADKDARDLVEIFRKVSDVNSVKVHLLTNEQATRSNILQLRYELEKTGVDDRVILFLASHGVLDDDLDYYIAMYDMDFSNPRNGGLRFDELENLLDSIPARNKSVLIDACHSGEVDKEENIIFAENIPLPKEITSRGFKAVKSKYEGIGLANSFELMKELFADLRRNNGSVVISSASGKEYAFEGEQWKNGVFTYAILEGFKNNKLDVNKDNSVTISELRDYVVKRVQELTNGKQNPTSRTENLENDFKVW